MPTSPRSVFAPDGTAPPPAAPFAEMRRETAVFVVASPRPATGKTFLARLLADFLRMDGAAAETFQLSPGDVALADLVPATISADLETTQGQMALFDRLIEPDRTAKVVDVGHASFERFFALAAQIDFAAAARARAIETIVLFAADAHERSIASYAALGRHLPECVLVPVFNDGVLKGRRLREHYPFTRAAAVPLQIPALAPGLRAHAERSGLSFADFHSQLPTPVPLGPAVELRSWTRRAFLEFRELELRLLLERLKTSLRN